jgi:hypothetical protein
MAPLSFVQARHAPDMPSQTSDACRRLVTEGMRIVESDYSSAKDLRRSTAANADRSSMPYPPPTRLSRIRAPFTA